VTVRKGSSRRPLVATFLWRRLNAPGLDVCRFIASPGKHELIGTAVFVEAKRVCQLSYHVLADTSFLTKRASVTGFVGRRAVDLRIAVSRGGHWTVNGVAEHVPAQCLDLDLGFTPATNLLALRRLRLSVGEEAQAPAAYLAFPRMKLGRLRQRYKRLSPTTYDYEAPRFNYRATLQVSAIGAVIDYPTLFAMEQVS
jgi:uncharacterized protein